MRNGVKSLIFAVFAVGCIASPADARPRHDGDGPAFDQVLPEIRRNQPGTFYDADGPFTGPDGRQHYRVKWMTPQGRVIWFDADARTGKVVHRDDYVRPDNRFNGRDDFDDNRDRGDGEDRKAARRNRFNDDDNAGDPFGSDDDRRGNNRRRNRDNNGGGGNGDWGGWGNGRGNGGGRDGGGFGNPGGNNRGHGHNPH
ncbi:MAG TPA: hypothetical protein VHL34_00110 [Rhizomicrobium sp.]|jgi:hypothetical protein|nr:hypothetical protein [Rhizomicrobium sp.]